MRVWAPYPHLPCGVYTQVFVWYEQVGVTCDIQVPHFSGTIETLSVWSGGVGFYIHFGVVFYNNRDLAKFHQPIHCVRNLRP